MNNKSKKQLRQEAINAELSKRERARAEMSPIDRSQMLSLVEYVGMEPMGSDSIDFIHL